MVNNDNLTSGLVTTAHMHGSKHLLVKTKTKQHIHCLSTVNGRTAKSYILIKL